MNTLIMTGGHFDTNFGRTINFNEYDYVIAADKGLEYASACGVMPDMILGDFDSYSQDELSAYEDRGIEILRFKAEKDETDTELAIIEAINKGSTLIDIYGATGGRLDHLFANIHNLKLAMDKGILARIIDEQNIIFLKNAKFGVNKFLCPKKYISLMPFAGEVRNINISGFKYNTDKYDLKPGVSRCVSNELLEAEGVIDFDEGILIVINSDDRQ